MNKPDCIKKLALISALLTGIYFAFSIIVVINPQIAANILGTYYASDIEIGFTSEVKTFLIIKELFILPLAAMAIYMASSKIFSHKHGMISVILSSVIYIIGMISSTIFHNISFRISPSISATATVSIVNNSKIFVNYFLLAALILLCCASAIEMYAAKHKNSDNNTLETTD